MRFASLVSDFYFPSCSVPQTPRFQWLLRHSLQMRLRCVVELQLDLVLFQSITSTAMVTALTSNSRPSPFFWISRQWEPLLLLRMLCGEPRAGRASFRLLAVVRGCISHLQQLLLTSSLPTGGNSYESLSFSGLPLTRLVPLFWLVEVSVLIKSDVKNRTGKVAQWVKCLLHTHEILSSNSQHPCKRMDGTLLS